MVGRVCNHGRILSAFNGSLCNFLPTQFTDTDGICLGEEVSGRPHPPKKDR